MCLIAFALGASERWPLVIASNRDEFLDRPTLPLAQWHTASGQAVISGRDLRAGGTWLGLTPGGRLAMLTNVREPQPSTGARSRGELVMRWLEGRMDAAGFMAQTDSTAYGRFNLVLGDFQAQTWHWLTNQPETGGLSASGEWLSGWHSQALGPGIYGLSNGALDTPWPKTLALKQALESALSAPDETRLRAGLWSALQNRARPRDEHLPRTGVSLVLEQALSSAFVEFPDHGYGTRCSTLLLASRAQGQAEPAWDLKVSETTYAHGPEPAPGERADPSVSHCRLVWQRNAAVKAS